MNLRFSEISKYIIVFLILTVIFFYISYRFDGNKARFSKVNIVFDRNRSDEFVKIDQLSQEIEFLCRNSNNKNCDVFTVPSLRNYVPLLDRNPNQVVNGTQITDFFSDYIHTSEEVIVSYVIANDLLDKTEDIQNTLQQIPKRVILAQLGNYRRFLETESRLLDMFKHLYSNSDLKNKRNLLQANEKKLSELESMYNKTPFMMLKNTNIQSLFRKINNTLRLVLSAIFSLIVIFYIRQVYRRLVKNRNQSKASTE